MKRTALFFKFLILSVFILITGCMPKKKIQTISIQQTDTVLADRSSRNFIADYTASKDQNVEIMEIEYFPPHADSPFDKAGQAIKKITAMKIKTVKNAVEKTMVTEQKDIIAQTHKKEQTQVMEKPAPDPYRWRYIFYGLAVLAAIIGFLWWAKIT